MRVVLGSVVLASVVPAGGMRSCAGAPSEPRAVSIEAPGRYDEVRLGCHDAAEVADADPEADTVPFQPQAAFAEPCQLVAYARTGALWQRTAPHALTPEDRRLELAFDAPVTAGIGVAFRRDPWRGEVLISGVQPGTPADGVLVPGDRVGAVDGHPVAAGRWGFVEAVTGAPGAPVTLSVLRKGAVREVTLVREVIPR